MIVEPHARINDCTVGDPRGRLIIFSTTNFRLLSFAHTSCEVGPTFTRSMIDCWYIYSCRFMVGSNTSSACMHAGCSLYGIHDVKFLFIMLIVLHHLGNAEGRCEVCYAPVTHYVSIISARREVRKGRGVKFGGGVGANLTLFSRAERKGMNGEPCEPCEGWQKSQKSSRSASIRGIRPIKNEAAASVAPCFPSQIARAILRVLQ